ncbi:restriction endonuclease PLD domain-containing protein [Desulfoplanes formicivorans]|uniref:NgoFVII family restriction endonuclease n=1 Tax=Desulfoplanes formicivorans TaxID=1592317 RepID=A0A194AHL6_9BACT|nr:restriction endonuclease PLD domain-containing protein [Desulfoplanes formicivorans]GAU08264.1 NgoFVII family restriction endonuclease [Desulfoplanes formicivorans]
MKLLSNLTKQNHRKRIVELISKSDHIVLCSGWMKRAGLKKILPALENAKQKNNAVITIYSNKKHTDEECIIALNDFRHIVVDDIYSKYLHTKIYYFQAENNFNAIIGSANITHGGLVSNDELSVEISGLIGSKEHQDISSYLEQLEKYA